MTTIQQRYEEAKTAYAKLGVDTDAVLKISQCENLDACLARGRCPRIFEWWSIIWWDLCNGNYPGAAHTPEELRQDLEKPTLWFLKTQIESSRHLFRHRGSSGSKWIGAEAFWKWVAWAKEQGLGLDFNPTFFSHPMFKDGFTLASPDEEVRQFWSNTANVLVKSLPIWGKKLGKSVSIISGCRWLQRQPDRSFYTTERLMTALDEIFWLKNCQRNTR